VDVCGEDLLRGAVLQIGVGVGYINSPLYPSNYPPNTNCYCHLVTTTVDSQIVLFLLDVKLAVNVAGADGNMSLTPVSGFNCTP